MTQTMIKFTARTGDLIVEVAQDRTRLERDVQRDPSSFTLTTEELNWLLEVVPKLRDARANVLGASS
jgi:hypothetical protein